MRAKLFLTSCVLMFAVGCGKKDAGADKAKGGEKPAAKPVAPAEKAPAAKPAEKAAEGKPAEKAVEAKPTEKAVEAKAAEAKPAEKADEAKPAEKAAEAKPAEVKPAAAPPAAPPMPAPDIAVGKAAPDFTLKNLAGEDVTLSSFKGKTVVLEWYNPECPFVRIAHGEGGGLKSAAKDYAAKGVVWLAINSGAPGKQGHGKSKNEESKKTFGLDHPILMDEAGTVGKVYQAQRTPHLYVIDAEGILRYRGALDTTGGGEPEGEVTHYLKRALDAVLGGKDVPEPRETKPWGCSVKYAR